LSVVAAVGAGGSQARHIAPSCAHAPPCPSRVRPVNKHQRAVYAKSGGKCIYCGGAKDASTIDHMPPRIMFSLKRRPAGLEFASCAKCNHSANLADQLCALIGRIYPDPSTDDGIREIQSLFEAVGNNIPGAIQEMIVSRSRQRRKRTELGLTDVEGGFLDISGPIVASYMQSFGARLGLAMHFHNTGLIVPPEGGVLVRVYSNVDLLRGNVPSELFKILPEPETLVAGKWTVEDQFRFGTRATDERGMSMSFATFRDSFAVLAACAADSATLTMPGIADDVVRFRPGQLEPAVPRTFRLGTRYIVRRKPNP
jgi:hypothetical protein